MTSGLRCTTSILESTCSAPVGTDSYSVSGFRFSAGNASLLKLPSVDLQDVLLSVMASHKPLLLIKDKCESGPILVNSTRLTTFLPILKQVGLDRTAEQPFKDAAKQHQLCVSGQRGLSRPLQKTAYALNHHPTYNSTVSPAARPHGSRNQGVEMTTVPLSPLVTC